MLRFTARMMAGALIGTMVVTVMVLGYVADLLDSELRKARNGTADGSPESLHGISYLDRAT